MPERADGVPGGVKSRADILDRRGLEGQESNARAEELELIAAPVKGLDEVERHNQSWSR